MTYIVAKKTPYGSIKTERRRLKQRIRDHKSRRRGILEALTQNPEDRKLLRKLIHQSAEIKLMKSQLRAIDSEWAFKSEMDSE